MTSVARRSAKARPSSVTTDARCATASASDSRTNCDTLMPRRCPGVSNRSSGPGSRGVLVGPRLTRRSRGSASIDRHCASWLGQARRGCWREQCQRRNGWCRQAICGVVATARLRMMCGCSQRVRGRGYRATFTRSHPLPPPALCVPVACPASQRSRAVGGSEVFSPGLGALPARQRLLKQLGQPTGTVG